MAQPHILPEGTVPIDAEQLLEACRREGARRVRAELGVKVPATLLDVNGDVHVDGCGIGYLAVRTQFALDALSN